MKLPNRRLHLFNLLEKQKREVTELFHDSSDQTNTALFTGLSVMAAGVAFSITADLGTFPISSVPM